MTEPKEKRARHNLAVLRRRVYLHDETFDPYDDDRDEAPPLLCPPGAACGLVGPPKNPPHRGAAARLWTEAMTQFARDVIDALSRSPQIAGLTFNLYAPRSGRARAAIARGEDPAVWLLDVATYGDYRQLATEEVSGWLMTMGLSMDSTRQALALGSQVRLADGRPANLLLLDFTVPPSPAAQAEIVHMLKHCGWRGWLLMSGASYHFVGADPMLLDDWRRAMARAQLIPGIDVRYMAHSLYNDQGGIRFTVCPVKPLMPYVVAELGVHGDEPAPEREYSEEEVAAGQAEAQAADDDDLVRHGPRLGPQAGR